MLVKNISVLQICTVTNNSEAEINQIVLIAS